MEAYQQDSTKLNDALFSEYFVNASLTQPSKELYFKYLEAESVDNLRSTQLKFFLKVSVFCSAKKLSIEFNSFSSFFATELVAWKLHRESFIRFINNSQLPEATRGEMQELVKSVDISKTCFSKLNSVWKKFNLQGNPEMAKMVFNCIWLIFLSARKALILRPNDLDDCVYLMVGVLAFASCRMPSRLALSSHSFDSLKEIFKVTENEVNFWTEKILNFCKERFLPNGLQVKKENLQGIFSWKSLKHNIDKISSAYQETLTWDLFDERALCEWEVEQRVMDKRSNRTVQSKVLKYEDQVTNFNEILNSKSNSSTPISYTMETLSWIKDIITEHYPNIGQVSENIEILPEKLQNLQSTFENLMLSKGETACITISVCIEDSNIQLKMIHFFEAMYQKVVKDRNLECEEESFEKSLFVFCIECVFFVKNFVAICFADLLDEYSCSGFDFYRNISVFLSIPQIPDRLKYHVEQIKVAILMDLGWKINGSIHLTIQDYLNNSNSKPLQDNFNKYKGIFPEQYEKFFDEMMIEVGIHIDLLCKSLKIEEPVCEKIWKTIKYILSERTEIFFGKHISLFILCCIFAVKRLEKPIKFNDIIHEYWKIFGEEKGIFADIKMPNGEKAGIVEYYNNVFVNEVKDFIDNRIQPLIPRVASLNPSNSLMEVLNSAGKHKKSPIVTPRTQCLLASPNVSGKNILVIKPLSFEFSEGHKVPRFIESVLNENNEDSIIEPIIKRNNE